VDLKALCDTIIDRLRPALLPLPATRELHAIRDGYRVERTDNRGPTRAHTFSDRFILVTVYDDAHAILPSRLMGKSTAPVHGICRSRGSCSRLP